MILLFVFHQNFIVKTLATDFDRENNHSVIYNYSYFFVEITQKKMKIILADIHVVVYLHLFDMFEFNLAVGLIKLFQKHELQVELSLKINASKKVVLINLHVGNLAIDINFLSDVVF